MPIRAVIFDVDGVLVATDEFHFAAWSAIADAEGIPFDRATNHALRGVSRMESLEILLKRATRRYTNDEKRRLADRKNALFQQAIMRLTPNDIAPGASELICELNKRRLTCAAASSSRNARRILERLKLDAAFQTILDGNDIARSKPDPEVFLRTAELLGVEPAACLVIEDAPAGIEAAHRAGMRAIGIGDPSVLAEADAVFASLGELDADSLLAAFNRRP